MKKQEKIELVKGLKKDLDQVAGIVAVDFTGLKVDAITEVRSKIKQSGGDFRVIKNNLIKLAAKAAGLKDLEAFLEGPTALGWHQKDIAGLAKILVELSKKYDHLKLKGGIVEGSKVDPAGLSALSRLPSRKELLSQLAGGISGGPRQFLWLLQSLSAKMAQLLAALKDKKPA